MYLQYIQVWKVILDEDEHLIHKSDFQSPAQCLYEQ